MPSFPPRSQEPYQKRELLEKRIADLQHAIRSGVAPLRLLKVAEKVRSAMLSVIKARRSIITSHPAMLSGNERLGEHRESLTRQLANVDQESERWSSLSLEEIVGLYAVEIDAANRD